MKKVIMIVMFSLVLSGFVSVSNVSAASCGNPADSTFDSFGVPINTFVNCGGGLLVPQKTGERFLKAGEEDCPSFYPQPFGYACVTTRPVGVVK